MICRGSVIQNDVSSLYLYTWSYSKCPLKRTFIDLNLHQPIRKLPPRLQINLTPNFSASCHTHFIHFRGLRWSPPQRAMDRNSNWWPRTDVKRHLRLSSDSEALSAASLERHPCGIVKEFLHINAKNWCCDLLWNWNFVRLKAGRDVKPQQSCHTNSTSKRTLGLRTTSTPGLGLGSQWTMETRQFALGKVS